jgi:hypothetical protein
LSSEFEVFSLEVLPSIPMRALRQRGVWIAAVWLTCQLAALATSPLVLACGNAAAMAAAAAVDDDACCKGLAPGQMCPLHKHRGHGHHGSAGQSSASAATDRDSRGNECGLRSTCDPIELAIQSLAGGVGMLPRVASVSDDLSVRATSANRFVDLLTRPFSLDPPPPRA